MKMYIIYEVRNEEYTALNDLNYNLECLKLFDNEIKAIKWFRNRIKLQCDRVKINNEIVYEKNNKNESRLWNCVIKEEKGLIIAYIYCNNEWQNTLYIKGMVVE